MQAITPELEALLKARLQAGSDGFRGRVEVDLIREGPLVNLNYLYGTMSDGGGNRTVITPAGANDGSNAGWASRIEAFATLTNQYWYGVWQTDLGAIRTVRSMKLIGRPERNTWKFWRSLNGTDWTDFTAEVTVNVYTGGLSEYDMDVTFAEFDTRYLRAENGLTAGGYLIDVWISEWFVYGTTTGLLPLELAPSRISIDKSLRMVADQAEIAIPNERLALGWGSTSILPTNCRLRVYQWYGDPGNEVLAFTGLVDRIGDSRDMRSKVLSCRDLMAILIDQTFGASAPQSVDETGAVRTPANGVYLAMEASDIVSDILDRAGWPAAERAITRTSYTLDEYVISDGTSWADAILGADRLAGLVGYDAWADEAGVFHFAPTYSAGALTDPATPSYTFRTGEDIVSLADETDQYDLRTRVKVRGPMTTQTLTDTWRELWRTRKISHPVGIWYDPADSANIRVIDRGTKRLYKLRQSDRVVVSSVYLGSVIPYPLGISGDPADASVYWVLNAPWYFTGSTAGNSVKKVRKSDNHVLASYSIPNGRWSAVKVSASYLYLTNLDTDRFYRRSKTDASAVADYRHTYSGVAQSNPSGIMIDGTTLSVFWSNGGTTARFLECDESAPGTVTKVVKTAGTALHGGEMDTTTHTECWGDADDLGLVAKFTLVDVSSQTDEVYAEAVDTALEDELGALAQSQPREHDTHPGDADHAFEIRRDTVDVTAIVSLAQATETAMRRLDKLAQRRRVADVGILGNPALQKTDTVRLEDPLTGLADDWIIDTYRSEMGDTYLGTLALLAIDLPTDAPADDGSATE